MKTLREKIQDEIKHFTGGQEMHSETFTDRLIDLFSYETAPLQARIEELEIDNKEWKDLAMTPRLVLDKLQSQLKAADSVNEMLERTSSRAQEHNEQLLSQVVNLTALAEQFKVMLEGQGKQNSLIYKQIELTLNSSRD